MTGYWVDIKNAAEQNEDFCRVLFTSEKAQLAVMSLAPGEEVGLDTHMDTDQFIGVEAGEGKAVLDGEEYTLKEGAAIVIPAGTESNVLNTSPVEALKLYCIYMPPEHPDGTIHKTKAAAEAFEVGLYNGSPPVLGD
jgi:mannose-6-phosphate isomerase-like protein (cupin superfamily)